MPLEYEIRDGALVWIRNPLTGVISYVVDVRAKSFAFTRSGRQETPPDAPVLNDDQMRKATARCPFCPGNESLSPREVIRVRPEEVPEWNGGGPHVGAEWVIRVINNLFPRIPTELTGGRNESYIVVEDPRHFLERPRSHADLMRTASLGESHFFHLLMTDARVIRRAMANPALNSVVIRKNQGPESGASQPHPHQQIIGSPRPLPAIGAEAELTAKDPGWWSELIELVARLGLVIEEAGEVLSYASPIGTFPRSYDVVMRDYDGLLIELEPERLRRFAGLLYRILRILGPLPLDYEIHQARGVPLHAHVNARHYPYSNVGGTLNLPSTLLENVALIRRAIARGQAPIV